jgi:predicted  nucleic acid-binding Zn-ribbon protein
MTALPTLIIEAEKSVSAVKAAADNFLAWLKSNQDAALQWEADFQQKRHAADNEIGRLRASIQQLRSEHEKEERTLAAIRKEIEHERKEIGRHREALRRTIDDVLGGPKAA